ncbi:hypothetical protein [Mycobacterium sp. M23085]|uniref:hypothetical protein n=1 Tax=Mycobacterium sp. M23085 TaxID=3378087 RepID=UPI003878319F
MTARLGGRDIGLIDQHRLRGETNVEDVSCESAVTGNGGIGVEPRSGVRPRYDLLILGLSPLDTVAFAGGWLCDRVRAGWQVSAASTGAADLCALQILGIDTSGRSTVEGLLSTPAAALGVSARAYLHNSAVRAAVSRAVREHSEVTFWADASLDHDFAVEMVERTLSPAARAYKSHALRAMGLSGSVGATERFCSCNMWYPPGPDLTPTTSTLAAADPAPLEPGAALRN